MGLSCPLGIFQFVPAKAKFFGVIFWQYIISNWQLELLHYKELGNFKEEVHSRILTSQITVTNENILNSASRPPTEVSN